MKEKIKEFLDGLFTSDKVVVDSAGQKTITDTVLHEELEGLNLFDDIVSDDTEAKSEDVAENIEAKSEDDTEAKSEDVAENIEVKSDNPIDKLGDIDNLIEKISKITYLLEEVERLKSLIEVTDNINNDLSDNIEVW